ncbi:CRISPR-associated protein Csx11 [Thermodesulfatator atlanticus]|uniref:CRISPR-associated protein Csx11 n=1 Tax=Thermodesulfatator atlanticus TaxID=501497 RepID=UPI0003B6D1F4|nr:CRISPR-associated protein Csx11 [Thermodesulfatator atlanticus]
MALKDLVDKRKDVLFAEIGALIHDLGKLSKEFVEGKDDYEEKDKDNVKKFRHEKIYVDLDVLLNTGTITLTNNNFIRKLLDLIVKKEPLKRLIQLKDKINQISSEIVTANDLPQWAKNDSILKNLDGVSKRDLDNFIQQLSDNTTFLKYSYIKSQFFVLPNNLLEQVYAIQIGIEEGKTWPMVLLPLQHHRSDKKAFGFDITNLPQEMKLILAPDGADGIDSAIDKMVTNHDIAKQSKDYTYISTAFGYENKKIDLTLEDTDENSPTKIRNEYANKLADILEDLKNNSDNIQNWINKRKELLKETRKAFLNALGETRRPANDVTLWDHSFSVGSLYKAAIAEVVINGWKAPKDIKWKLLGIRFDGNDFYNAVPKIGDVLGRKALVQKVLDNIKILLEVIIPIGNEIYRDENGSVFLVPETCENNKILEIDDDVWNSIKFLELPAELDYNGSWNEKSLKDIIYNCSNIKELIEKLSSFMCQGIITPQIVLSESSRGALNLGKILSKKRKWEPDIERLKQKWNGKTEGYEKCTVCNLKPVPLTEEEYESLKNRNWNELAEEEKNRMKAYERKECLDCLKLSSNRVEEWYKNENWKRESPEKPSFDTTIWVDEVADENDRVGLIYLKFDLEKWLNGEMLNTFLSIPFLEKEYEYNELIEKLEIIFEEKSFNDSIELTKKDGTTISKNVKEFLKSFVFIKNEQNPEEVFKSIIESREPDWQQDYPCPSDATPGDNKHKAAVFLLHATRKHPSFARLRRIWQTTKNFGIDIFEEVKEKLNTKERYMLEVTDSPNLKITHTYYFKDEKGNKGEIVVLESNKAAVISVSKDFTPISEQPLYIFRDKFFKNLIGNLRINNIEKKQYTAITPYQFEPSNTMFFVPLKEVWEIIKDIKKKYEIEFSKVQNRLPIKVGFVAFHKRTPMYAVLDTARRLMELKNSRPELIKVCKISESETEESCRLFEGKLGNKVKKIKFENEEVYYFSYSTGDPNKEDLFHPYFIVENNNGWKVPISKNKNKEWKTIKHVKNLQTDDEVWFYTSYFDFIYLDTNTRRLDVGKERKHWLFKKKSPKPYRLKQIEEFENLRELLLNKLKLTSSQLLNAYGMLIEKLQNWEVDKTDNFPITDRLFEEFVENVILSIPFRLKLKEETKKGQISRKDFEFLKKTMLNGVFFDFIDMWHTVLKRKFNEEEQNV